MWIQITFIGQKELFHPRVGTNSNRMGHSKMQLLPQRDREVRGCHGSQTTHRDLRQTDASNRQHENHQAP